MTFLDETGCHASACRSMFFNYATERNFPSFTAFPVRLSFANIHVKSMR